jgi:hypothetical protein
LIAGPESPPVPNEIRGFAVSGSIAMPTSVLMSDRTSAPASRARAGRRDEIGGVGRQLHDERPLRGGADPADERRRQLRRVPEEHAARSTFGQEMLSSIAARPSAPSRARATAT